MVKMLKALLEHLRQNRDALVRDVDVRVETYDPTYGLQDDSRTIEVIDFDQLLNAMDDFAATFKQD